MGEFKKRSLQNFDKISKEISVTHFEELRRAYSARQQDIEEAKKEFPEPDGGWEEAIKPDSGARIYGEWWATNSLVEWYVKWFGDKVEDGS